jgi:putative oxidoreductase
MTVTTTARDALTSFGLLILRLGAGVLMATHGWGKVKMVFDGQFDQFGDPLGIGKTMSLIGAATGEFACSMLVVIGLLTRLGAAGAAFTMGVAAFIVHQNDPWTASAASGGANKEPALLFMTCFLTLVFTGAGKYSLDAMLFRRKVAVKAVKT